MNFKRVIHNLLLNASKYAYSDTDVTLNLYSENDKIFITVTNFGDTINEDEMKLIFEKYYSGTFFMLFMEERKHIKFQK